MNLEAYLERIGHRGEAVRGVETLRAVHRRHLQSIPFENIDVLLGRRVDLDPVRIFDKLVTGRRGGWCYEMNGLLGWALGAIGFPVTRLAAGVERRVRGEQSMGNHLALLVEADGERWLADVGFGDGLFEPTLMVEGSFGQRGFEMALEDLGDGWWRFHTHRNAGGLTYDFTLEPAEDDLLVTRCAYLATSPDSGFTQTLTAQTHRDDRVEVLRNTVRSTVHPDRVRRWLIPDRDAFLSELHLVFGLDDPEAARLWPGAEAAGRSFVEENPDLFDSDPVTPPGRPARGRGLR